MLEGSWLFSLPYPGQRCHLSGHRCRLRFRRQNMQGPSHRAFSRLKPLPLQSGIPKTKLKWQWKSKKMIVLWQMFLYIHQQMMLERGKGCNTVLQPLMFHNWFINATGRNPAFVSASNTIAGIIIKACRQTAYTPPSHRALSAECTGDGF